jgi:hypothetical protein
MEDIIEEKGIKMVNRFKRICSSVVEHNFGKVEMVVQFHPNAP